MNSNSNKFQKIIIKYNLSNIIKVCIIIIVLLLIFQIFTTPLCHPFNTLLLQQQINYNPNNNKSILYSNQLNTIENFDSNNDSGYGNQIILNSLDQVPVSSDNKYTFKFNGIYRVEGIQIKTANSTSPIYIQYYNSNNNLIYIKSKDNNNSSPPNHSLDSNNSLTIINLKDENNLDVYASTIIISSTSSNSLSISNFAFHGCTREMLSHAEYDSLSVSPNITNIDFTNSKSNPNYTNDIATNSNIYKYTNSSSSDRNVYSIKLQYKIVINENTTTSEPNNLNISYNNAIYPGNTFKLNTTYYIRTDPKTIDNGDNTKTLYIYFTQPVIANQFILSLLINTNNKQIDFLSLNAHCEPLTSDIINNYKRMVNILLNNSSSQDTQTNMCPSLDIIVTKQDQVQQLCNNLDYQDKIASEKIRLEKNKQYLLKLKEQQQQIDQLNTILNTLNTKREQRSKNSDIARVLQYQQQKNIASTVVDLANQRLESQDNNKLYLDVNINNTNTNTTNTTLPKTQTTLYNNVIT